MTPEPFSLTERFKSVVHAGKGIALMVRTEHNAWLHVLATVLICLLSFLLHISRPQWCLIILAIVSVWMAEALNTALELLADVASPDFHPLVKKAKDVAAGAVLISAIGAAMIAILILGPYFY